MMMLTGGRMWKGLWCRWNHRAVHREGSCNHGYSTRSVMFTCRCSCHKVMHIRMQFGSQNLFEGTDVFNCLIK